MVTLKIKCHALIRICPKTDSLPTLFFKQALKRNLTFTMWKWYWISNFTKMTDENQVQIVKVRFAMDALLKKKVDKLSVLGQNLIKA